MFRAGSQVTPPSVVRENQIGSRNVRVLIAPSMLAREVPLGSTNRSQAAYAYPALSASAVTDSLSLNANATSRSPESRIIVHGSLHVSPPSVDRLARTALTLSRALNDRATWYAVPSAPNDTQGSDARS